jgi:hypothetical protein
MHAAAIPCATPLASTPMLVSHARDSYVATAATSCRRCRPSTPRATHTAIAPCDTSSRYRSVGEAISPLPVTAAERRPLLSALAALLSTLVATLLCSKCRSTDHPALMRLYGMPSRSLSYCPPQATVEAPSRSPPTCFSVTAATSARAHRRSTNPEPALSTSSLACDHRFPSADLRRHREPTTVSPSTAYAPNRDPQLRGLLPGTSFPGCSPLVGRIQSASRAPVKNRGAPLFWPSGPSRFHRLAQALQQA